MKDNIITEQILLLLHLLDRGTTILNKISTIKSEIYELNDSTFKISVLRNPYDHVNM